MTVFRTIAVIAACALPALPVAAQQAPQRGGQRAAAATPAAPGLTLAEAERLLVERNLTVAAARYGVDAVRAQRLVASSIQPMQFTVGSTAGQFNEYNGTVNGVRVYSPANNVSVGLMAVIELGGKRGLRVRTAEEQIGAAEAQVLDALRGQMFALRQAYFGALAARANLDVARATLASFERTEGLLRHQAELGQSPEGDVIRFRASRPPFEADVASARQALAAQVATMAALVAGDALPAGGGGAYEPRGRLDRTPPLGMTRNELAEAVPRRADVVAAERGTAAASANRELAEAGRWRDVTIGGAVSRSRLQQDLPNDASASTQVGISLSVPLFTHRIVEGNIGVAAAQQRQAEANAASVLAQARADFATSWASYEQAQRLLAVYNGQALRQAEEAYTITERAYLAGGRSLIDVLDSLRTLNQTRLAANEARRAYLVALADLERASGASGIVTGF